MTPAGQPRRGRKTAAKPRRMAPRCNSLDGRQWLQNSISVWSDVGRTGDERKLKHPAMFPGGLVERLIQSFLRPDGRIVLDPFSGSGSTVVAAERLGLQGIGLELSAEYVSMSEQRLREINEQPRSTIHQAPAARLTELVAAESVDLCITSPPYWNILNQKRTADYKSVRHYGNLEDDLGTIEDYSTFLSALTAVFRDVLTVLKPGAYCCVVVMDLRKKDRFFPLHSDLARELNEAGYIFDDLIIWNRQSEYNNLRPLGYPAVFRINKVHEFIVILRKPPRRDR